MERAAFSGEPGYVAAQNPENPKVLNGNVMTALQGLNIPLIRWPAGGDLMRINWKDAIDHVPGREGGRPMIKGKNATYNNEFGLDEFLILCETLGSEPLLPIRLHPAISNPEKIDHFAQEAAEFVAYCNGDNDKIYSGNLGAWPKLRQKNGRSKSWNVKYFQIGNESWHYFGQILQKKGMAGAEVKEKAEFYLKPVRAYLAAMKAVDPEIKIIVDGVTGQGRWVDQLVVTDPFVRSHSDYVALHAYQPWGINEVTRNGTTVPFDQLKKEEVWYNWVSCPEMNMQTYQSEVPPWPDWWLIVSFRQACSTASQSPL